MNPVEIYTIKLREMMARSGGRKAVPQIFIGGAHVGGLAELTALERSGGLDSLLGGKDR